MDDIYITGGLDNALIADPMVPVAQGSGDDGCSVQMMTAHGHGAAVVLDPRLVSSMPNWPGCTATWKTRPFQTWILPVAGFSRADRPVVITIHSAVKVNSVFVASADVSPHGSGRYTTAISVCLYRLVSVLIPMVTAGAGTAPGRAFSNRFKPPVLIPLH